MKTIAATTIFAIAFWWTVILLATAIRDSRPPAVPHCEEDQYIVGQGDFHAGYWDRYGCLVVSP